MQVRLQLQGPLQKYGKTPGFFELETAAETCTLKELLRQLGVSDKSVAFASVNGLKTELDCLLRGGETIVVYPRVAGG